MISNSDSIFTFGVVIATSLLISLVRIRKPFRYIPLLISVLILGFLVAFRGELTGTDTNTYRRIYSGIIDPSKRIFENIDPIYVFLMWRLRTIIDDGGLTFQIINAVIQFSSLFYAWTSAKIEKFKPEYGLIIFIGLSSYLNYFNGMRSATSSAIGLLAFSFLLKEKLLIYYLLIFFGILIHKGLILLIIFPLLPFFKFSKRNIFFTWIFSLIFAVGNLRVIFLSDILSYLSSISSFFERGMGSFDISKIQLVKFIGFNALYFLLISRKNLDFKSLNKYILSSFLFIIPFSNCLSGSGLLGRLLLPFDAICTISIPYLLLSIVNKKEHKLLIILLSFTAYLAIMRSIINDSNGILPLTLDFF